METTKLTKSKKEHDPAVPDQRPKNPPANAFPREGYALLVDGRIKSQYETGDEARAAGAALKKLFPVVQVTVLDAKAGTRTVLDAAS